MDYAVIMAGGTGKRLWPLSRRKRPKQVLKLIDGQTLLRLCFKRLVPIFDVKNIIVLTNINYIDTVCEELPELPIENIIAEPAVRDTVGAIGLAATILSLRDPNATMAVVTADQLIKPAEVFQQALKDAIVFINDNPDNMITFGIQPTSASTQFGYIKLSAGSKYAGCENEIYTVESFREKPNEKTASEYIQAGCYMWNAGLFVWKAETVFENLRKFLPEATEPLEKIKAGWNRANRTKILNEWFVKLPKISIDYAVMEKSDKVNSIKLNCHWLDMGDFRALADFVNVDNNGNVITAELSEIIDSKNNIIVTEDKNHLIAAIGLDGLVIAHTPDATLICKADQTDKLKELLEKIEQNKGEKFI